MCDHTLQVDHRFLHHWRCAVDKCKVAFGTLSQLSAHRQARHGVPAPSDALDCGRHPQRTFCFRHVCRGDELNDVVATLRQLDVEFTDLLRQVRRVRSRRGASANLDLPPLVRPLPRGELLLQHLISAAIEHDWPRPPPADGLCSACLQRYDAHAFVRCGERLPVVDERAAAANNNDDNDDDDDDGGGGGGAQFSGPNSAWSWQRPLVYCGRSYHTYCLMPTTTITSGDIWLAAHVRAREFCISLPGKLARTSMLEQTKDDHWRCSECALGHPVPRPRSTPADATRLKVPLLAALSSAVHNGHASPYAHRALSTLVQIVSSCPLNITSLLQAVGWIDPSALRVAAAAAAAAADHDQNDDAAVASAMQSIWTTIHGADSHVPLPRGRYASKRKSPSADDRQMPS